MVGTPGIMELAIIGLLGLICIGVPLVVIGLLVVNRKSGPIVECMNCGKVSPPSDFCPHCGAKHQ